MWTKIAKIAEDHSLDRSELLAFAGRMDIVGTFPIVRDEILMTAIADFVATAVVKGVSPKN